jgi:hypothetical protein
MRKRLVRIATVVAAGIHVDQCGVELRDLVKQPRRHASATRCPSVTLMPQSTVLANDALMAGLSHSPVTFGAARSNGRRIM